jgi:hypothetical protein
MMGFAALNPSYALVRMTNNLVSRFFKLWIWCNKDAGHRQHLREAGVGEMKTIVTGVALWTAILVSGAQAGTIIGEGTISCAKWTEDQRNPDYALMNGAWLAGYLSNYSIYTNDAIDLPDPAARNGWVSTYCRTHPLDKLWEAADELILELKRRASRR